MYQSTGKRSSPDVQPAHAYVPQADPTGPEGGPGPRHSSSSQDTVRHNPNASAPTSRQSSTSSSSSDDSSVSRGDEQREVHGSRMDYSDDAPAISYHPSNPSKNQKGSLVERMVGTKDVLVGKMTGDHDKVVHGVLKKRGEKW